MEYVVGVDAGASRTRALALGRDGAILRVHEAGGANFTASPEAEANARTAIAGVLSVGQPAAIALCAAGLDSPPARDRALAFLAGEKPTIPRVVTHDARAALYAASREGVGVVLVSGTGAIAYGRDARGREARASGWGHLIGDEGSLVWLGREALRAAARAADGRGERTGLLAAVLAELSVPDLRAAVDPLYHEAHPATAILGAARALARVLEDGDAVASRIVAVGADELARAAAAVARALRLEEVFLAGGAFAAIPALENAARARLAAVLPEARVETSRVDSVRGAARIAALAAWDEPV